MKTLAKVASSVVILSMVAASSLSASSSFNGNNGQSKQNQKSANNPSVYNHGANGGNYGDFINKIKERVNAHLSQQQKEKIAELRAIYQLDLSDEQKDAIKEIVKNYGESVKALEGKDVRKELFLVALSEEGFDGELYAEGINELNVASVSLKSAMLVDVIDILSADQRIQLEDILSTPHRIPQMGETGIPLLPTEDEESK